VHIAPAFGGFGAAAPAPAFGAPQPAPSGGLFGSAAPTPASGGLFGAAPAPTGGLFGAPATTPKAGGLFGAPAPGKNMIFSSFIYLCVHVLFNIFLYAAPAFGGFGSTAPAPAFGAPQPAPAGGGLFGSAPAPTPAGGLFGAAPTTPAAGGGLFGSTATPAPAGGLFGSTAPAPIGGMFGSAPTAVPQPVAAAPIVAPTPSADVLLAQQLATVENQKKQLELTEAWRGNPPSGSKVIASSFYDNSDRGWDSYTTQSSALMSYRAVPRSAAKIRPRGFTPSKQSPIAASSLKSGGSRNNGSPFLSPNGFISSATKSLIIKPGSLTPKPKTRLLLTNGIASERKDPSVANLENGRFESPHAIQYPTQDLQSHTPASTQPDSASPREGSHALNGNASPAQDFYRQVVGSPNGVDVHPASTSPRAMIEHIPTLTKVGYLVHPPINELAAKSEADLAAVSGFKVERPGFGSVEWEGAVDVRGVDIDSTVIIESKNVAVYDDAELNGNKPAQGSKLNRPAVITMYGIFPKSGADSTAEAKEKFSTKLAKTTKKMGAELISFDVESGVWKFRVGHFSKYGFNEDDSDSDDDANDTPSLATSLDEDERTELGGVSHFRAPTNEDDSTSGSAFSDVIGTSEYPIMVEDEEEEENELLEDANNAYDMITEELAGYQDTLELHTFEHEQPAEVLLFPIEADNENFDDKTNIRLLLPSEGRRFLPSRSGICSKLATQCGLQPSSSKFDYGLRMRKTFRVGWRPDGSFLHLKPSSNGKHRLVQSKPQISEETVDPLPLFKTHQKHSKPIKTDAEAPLFRLPQSSNAAIGDYVDSSASYALRSDIRKAVSSSFSLMACLYGGDDATNTTISSHRRLEAVSNWMKQVVADSVSNDIFSAQSKGDTYGSIFVALSGGDTSKASSLALDSGHHRLSLMLASSGAAGRSLFESQMEIWNKSGAESYVPSGILRLFSLSSGSLDTEKSLFKASKKTYQIDWRRRFGMYLWSCRHEESTISSLVEQYNSDVSNGVAPYPTPLYDGEITDSTLSVHKCVLHQILNHYTGAATLPGISSPPSHTTLNHDFSASFHLAACMTSLTKSSLTLNQEHTIIDAISSQLIMDGYWEWAVYATLSLIGNSKLTKSTVASRVMRARNVISMFYTSSNSYHTARRSFLENLGVPSEWFSAAVAYRSASEGAVFTHVEHLVHFDTLQAFKAVENIIIPHYILEGNDSRDQLMHILQSMGAGSHDLSADLIGASLCEQIYDFLLLSKKVQKLSLLSSEDLEIRRDEIQQMINQASTLQQFLFERHDTVREETPLVKIPFEVKLTPRHVYLVEVYRMLTNFRIQLLASEDGTPHKSKGCSSELVFALNADGLFGNGDGNGDSGCSILRGMSGFTA